MNGALIFATTINVDIIVIETSFLTLFLVIYLYDVIFYNRHKTSSAIYFWLFFQNF